MYLDPRSRTEVGAYWTGDYEVPIVRLMRAFLPPGAVALDVGANVGLVTVALASHIRDSGGGRVVAFEPTANNYARLTENVRLNGLEPWVQTVNVALGDAEGEIEIATESEHGAATGNAVFSSAVSPSPDMVVSRARVARLDDLAADLRLDRVDLVKADVEGAEVLFMRGARGVLARHRPVILGEFARYWIAKFGHSVRDAFDVVRPLGYRAFSIQRSGALSPVPEVTEGMMELVFVPDGLPRSILTAAGVPAAL